MNTLNIEIVSDVVCPWCAVGYAHLQQALQEVSSDGISADIQWRAFELNPHMGKQGQEINEHLMEKYGSTEAQLAANKQRLVELGNAAGVDFKFGERSRIYNTFDCHKLLHWAADAAPTDASETTQTQLKQALFKAYFTDGQDISDRSVLLDAAESVGLDREQAKEVLESDAMEQAVRDEQAQFQSMGISAVPAFIINHQYLISGGQAVETFKQALAEIAAKEAVS